MAQNFTTSNYPLVFMIPQHHLHGSAFPATATERAGQRIAILYGFSALSIPRFYFTSLYYERHFRDDDYDVVTTMTAVATS